MATTKRASATPGEGGLSAAEKAALKDRAAEVRATKRAGSKADKAAADVAAVVAKIAELDPADRELAERIHTVITRAAPDLAPRLWYGMPAYAHGKDVICFLQPAAKFGTRYATLGFSDKARLDDGPVWPSAYAVSALTPQVEDQIADLVRRAVAT